jgi:hypothetical protein
MDLGRYGKFRKRQTVSFGSVPRIPVQKKNRTYGSDELRGWRHGIRRAHKVTIDLAEGYRNQPSDTMGPHSQCGNLIICETRGGFHASFGRVTPAPGIKKKRRVRCGRAALDSELTGADSRGGAPASRWDTRRAMHSLCRGRRARRPRAESQSRRGSARSALPCARRRSPS